MLMLVKSLATEIFIAEVLGTTSCNHAAFLLVFKHHQIASNFKFSVSLSLGLIFPLS